MAPVEVALVAVLLEAELLEAALLEVLVAEVAPVAALVDAVHVVAWRHPKTHIARIGFILVVTARVEPLRLLVVLKHPHSTLVPREGTLARVLVLPLAHLPLAQGRNQPSASDLSKKRRSRAN